MLNSSRILHQLMYTHFCLFFVVICLGYIEFIEVLSFSFLLWQTSHFPMTHPLLRACTSTLALTQAMLWRYGLIVVLFSPCLNRWKKIEERERSVEVNPSCWCVRNLSSPDCFIVFSFVSNNRREERERGSLDSRLIDMNLVTSVVLRWRRGR